MNRSTAPPATSAQLACPCCLGTYRYSEKHIRRGKIQPNPACRHNRIAESSPNPGAMPGVISRATGELNGALVVGACLIAAVRLGSEAISSDAGLSHVVTSTVGDAVRLAREVLNQIETS